MRVAVLIPVLERPQNVAPLVASLQASVEGAVSLEVVARFICSPDDRLEQRAVQQVGLEPLIATWKPGRGDYAKKINLAASAERNAEWVFLAADDLEFVPGWLQACLIEHYMTNACVIGTNDEANFRTRAEHSTHTLVHRDYVNCGAVDGKGLLHPGYDHNFVDDELVATAMARETYTHAPNAVVRHRHPLFKTAEMDSTYQKALRDFPKDKALFRERSRLWAKPLT